VTTRRRGNGPGGLSGLCDARFRPVRDAMAANLEDEIGAAVVVRIGDAVVVDLWGGWADAARTRAWKPDTVVDVLGQALSETRASRASSAASKSWQLPTA
jgi:hypothetical protein